MTHMKPIDPPGFGLIPDAWLSSFAQLHVSTLLTQPSEVDFGRHKAKSASAG